MITFLSNALASDHFPMQHAQPLFSFQYHLVSGFHDKVDLELLFVCLKSKAEIAN